ncbi:cyclophilin-RNA interacting protein [Cryptosporidium ryanae]|uniref:cyclophilin-RNA interacting protein n=1 Tax=Cryptosporidium ryanae TaxID=515981 RepID=UPI00351A74A7|nr:cyclophilin-RNA interacting protein [Cryptosporidium ryanae]
MSVLIVTTLGDIVIDLITDLSKEACINFLKLCKIKYYNNSEFYKIEKGFIARTGNSKKHGNISIYDLLGKGIQESIEERIVVNSGIKHNKAGRVGFVNRINNKKSIGSEFYITFGINLPSLDGNHVIFGQVEEGIDTLNKLENVITDDDFSPLARVRILHTYILDDPYEDLLGLSEYIPLRSPRPEVDDNTNELNDEDEIRILDLIAAREAKSRAITLEILGDIPSADFKPPENILFVCKLNPVTEDEDLELIFSRFGNIKSCNIVRDYKTRDSLQYAFIEFETKDECELAFLKMQDAIIDDRR